MNIYSLLSAITSKYNQRYAQFLEGLNNQHARVEQTVLPVAEETSPPVATSGARAEAAHAHPVTTGPIVRSRPRRRDAGDRLRRQR